jgi:hypothetical protein
MHLFCAIRALSSQPSPDALTPIADVAKAVPWDWTGGAVLRLPLGYDAPFEGHAITFFTGH